MNQEDNLTQYEKSHRSLFDRVHQNSISLTDSTVICRRCQRTFAKAEFIQHAKNCKRYSQKNSTRRMEVSRTDTVNFVQPAEQTQSTDEFYNNLLTSVLAFIKTGVSQLLANTKYLKRGVVLQILGKKCISFAAQIPEIINQNDYRNLVSDKFMSQVLKGINDVFQPTLVESRIAKFSESRKTKIRRKLNSYLKSLEIEPLYVVQKVVHKFQRAKFPLMFRELSSFVLKLFATKKKKYVHLGLDLLIIYHSMQRFPSSINIVKTKVLQLMKRFKQTQAIYVTIEETTKTKQKEDMFLNHRLIQLLIQFGWTEFAFGNRFYERISEYVNFSMYSLRRGVITQADIFLYKTDVSILTNHVSSRSPQYYLVELRKLRFKQFHESFQLRPDEELKAKYARYQSLDRIFPRMLKPLHISGQNFQLTTSLPQPKTTQLFAPDKNKMVPQGLADPLSEHEDDSQSEESSAAQSIEVEGMSFKLKDGIFADTVFIEQKSKQNCRACNKGTTTMICFFCLKAYHVDCLPEFCSCMKLNTQSLAIKSAGPETNNNSLITMPAEYFHSNSHLLASIRKFIHMRGFYFTTCATLLSPRDITAPNFENAKQFSFPDYHKYEAGDYFPPLLLGVSGDDNPGGTGIGVFCAEDIKKNVLIGEYGGDIVSEDEMIFIKRRDMSMQLTEVSGEKFYVGCVKHCSYVQLINSSKEKANCKIVTVIVNKKIKLLLYTTQDIKSRQELLYDYGEGFGVKFKNKLRQILLLGKGNDPQEPIITVEVGHHQDQSLKEKEILKMYEIEVEQSRPEVKQMQLTTTQLVHHQSEIGKNTTKKVIKASDAEDKKIKKLMTCSVILRTNTCYAQCLFMVYKYLQQYFVQTQSNLAYEIKKSRMNPIEFIQQFKKFKEEAKNKNKLTNANEANPDPNEQEDIMEFYYFIQEKILKDDSPFHEMAVSETKQCQTCQQTTLRFITEKQWYLDIGDEKVSLATASQVEVHCQFCKANTIHRVVKKLQSTPELLILTFKRNVKFADIKLKYKVDLSLLKEHNGVEYELEIVAVHIGDNASSGHYVVHFPKYNFMFDQNKFVESKGNFSRDVYMAIFIKKLPAPVSKARKHNAPLPSAGIYIQINEKLEQNVDKSYKIASVVKLITYLVCEKLRCRFGIPLQQVFIVPKVQVYGLNIVLTENEEVSLQTLFELMLIISSADAAASLAIIFGNMLKQQNLDLLPYTPEAIFVSEMIDFCRREIKMMDTVIKDACGLKPNLSTAKDLKLLLQFIKEKQDLLEILKRPNILFQNQAKQNTNQLYKICVGKTGSYNGGYCFVGLHEKDAIICLDFTTQKSLFNFIEDRINLKNSKKQTKKV